MDCLEDYVSRLGLQGSTRVQVQSSFERVTISWNLAEASRQCCLCSLSSAPLPCTSARGPSGLMGKSIWLVFKKVLGSNPSWVPFLFPWICFSLSWQQQQQQKPFIMLVYYIISCKLVVFRHWLLSLAWVKQTCWTDFTEEVIRQVNSKVRK